LQKRQHFLFGRNPSIAQKASQQADVLFGDHTLSVDEDFKLARFSWDQPGFQAKILFNGGRETRGPRLIASAYTVVDFDIHGLPLGSSVQLPLHQGRKMSSELLQLQHE